VVRFYVKRFRVVVIVDVVVHGKASTQLNFTRLLKKAYLLRCARSPRSNVLLQVRLEPVLSQAEGSISRAPRTWTFLTSL
ncbi:MAG TPA: hypothetical protein VFM35_09700, partial [Candidatus Binatia bacterium]|nr:hypothetical protein [Candidatus Binatia bacterium]